MLLLITDRALIARVLTQQLFSHGIFSFRTPLETARLYCDQKDTGGVLLDCVNAVENAIELCADLRARYPEMPIAAIVPKQSLLDLPVDILLRDGNLDAICNGALEFCLLCGWMTGQLCVYGLSVGETPDRVFYMGYRLHLSPREYAILRCLFYRMPRITNADELMSLCFPGARIGFANLSVQIANINRRAAEIDPRPLIVNIYGKGYRLREGL